MPNKKIKIPKKLMGKKLEGEWVFLNLENGVYYGLNKTGSLIWDKLKKNKDPKKITDQLQAAFGVDRDKLEKDVKKFLKELKKEGLVEVEAFSA